MLRLLLLLAALCLPAAGKESQLWNCVDDFVYNTRTCDAYIDPTGIAVSATDAGASNVQLQNQWCWAASIEMASRYWGYYLPQAKIVETTWGSIVNMPGYPAQIIAAVNRPYVDSRGKTFSIQGLVLADWTEVAASLAANYPVLIGSQGHMTLLIGLRITFFKNQFGQVVNFAVNEAVLLDPWPGRGVRDMTASEYYNAFLAISVGTTAVTIPVSIRRTPAPKASKSLAYFNVLGRPIQRPSTQ